MNRRLPIKTLTIAKISRILAAIKAFFKLSKQIIVVVEIKMASIDHSSVFHDGHTSVGPDAIILFLLQKLNIKRPRNCCL